MALGVLSSNVISHIQDSLIETLLTNCIPRGGENDDAESRKFAVSSLTAILETLGVQTQTPDLIKRVLDTFYKAIDDYAIDRRGDVGSWVREEAMESLFKLHSLILRNKGTISLTKEDYVTFFGYILQ